MEDALSRRSGDEVRDPTWYHPSKPWRAYIPDSAFFQDTDESNNEQGWLHVRSIERAGLLDEVHQENRIASWLAVQIKDDFEKLHEVVNFLSAESTSIHELAKESVTYDPCPLQDLRGESEVIEEVAEAQYHALELLGFVTLLVRRAPSAIQTRAKENFWGYWNFWKWSFPRVGVLVDLESDGDVPLVELL